MTTRRAKVKHLHAYVQRNSAHAESLLERATKLLEEARAHLKRNASLEDELEPMEDEAEKEPR
jgi:hypothetical protein